MAGLAPTTTDSTALALQRTLLALDRTLMAWVRTAVSLISFGFTIYKFFQTMEDNSKPLHVRLLGPRSVPLVMISLGIACLILGMIEYRSQITPMRVHYAAYGLVQRSYVTYIAGVMIALGLFGFVSVVFQL